MKAVGARLPRYDGVAHVTGRTVFVDDVRVQGTLCVKALRSPLDNAGILKLDTKRAEKMAGVRAVVTHKDVPLNVYGHLSALGIPADEHGQHLRPVPGRGESVVGELDVLQGVLRLAGLG